MHFITDDILIVSNKDDSKFDLWITILRRSAFFMCVSKIYALKKSQGFEKN